MTHPASPYRIPIPDSTYRIPTPDVREVHHAHHQSKPPEPAEAPPIELHEILKALQQEQSALHTALTVLTEQLQGYLAPEANSPEGRAVPPPPGVAARSNMGCWLMTHLHSMRSATVSIERLLGRLDSPRL